MSHPLRFDSIASTIRQKGTLAIPCGKVRMFQWFALVNAAVVVSLSLITDWRIALLLTSHWRGAYAPEK